MDRRKFTVGAGVAGVALAAGMVPGLAKAIESLPLPGQPLSPLFSPTLTWALYPKFEEVSATSYRRMIGLELIKSSASNLVKVSSVEEAEDHYFASLGKSHAFYDHSDMQAALAILNHQANMIAVRTWRRAGNVVLAHPRVYKNVLGSLITPKRVALSNMSTWKHAGLLNGSLTAWSNERLPDDRVYVVYVCESHTSVDAPGGLAFNDGGDLIHLRRTDGGLNHGGVIGVRYA